MKLMTPEAWVEKYFDQDSKPPETTLRRWLRIGAVPSRKVGGTWFIDEHAWIADGDDLMQKVLKAG